MLSWPLGLVLNDEVAILTDATPEGLSVGIVRALSDVTLTQRISDQAVALADSRYSYEAYLDRTREACAALADKTTAELVAT